MPTSYTPLLGLALPVTGELSGVWGDTVNDYITQYLDGAVAGTQTISGSQTAVTLSKTTASALTQVGSGATGSSQYSIINCTGNPASLLTITAPAASKPYIIINATSTAQSVKIVGAGPTTGVTLVSGEKAVVAWNGSDFIKIATSTADGVTTIDFGTTGLTPSTATSGAVTVAGTLAVGSGGTGITSGTSGGVPYFSASNTIASSAALAANALVVGGGAGVAPSTITTGTGVTTALGVNTGSAGAFVVNGGALGTPSSGTLTNATGLPISTGVSGLGTNVATALGTNVGTAGAFVVNGGALGTPSSGTLTNATGLPLSTGVTGTLPVANGGTNATATPTAGAVAYGTGTAYAFTSAGTAGQVLQSNGASAPTWANAATGDVTAAGNNAFTGANTFYNATGQTFGTGTSTQDGIIIAGRAGGSSSYRVTLTPTTLTASRTVTLPDANTTIPVATQVLTFSGPTAARTITLPDANFTAARTDAGQTFTGTQTVLAAATQDAIALAGRAGGTSSYVATLTPATLSANRTVTIPNETFTVGFRNLPAVGTQTGSYTLGVNDVGKYVQVSTGGSITIPTSTFAEGDAITLYNNTTGNITITCSAPTAYIAGTNTVKTSMTLATRGVATILFYSATACVVSGNVS